MSCEYSIVVDSVSKVFPVFRKPFDIVKHLFFYKYNNSHDSFTALNNISFKLLPGESLAILGKNGSGKSTLLQIICGILAPTSGAIVTKGRILAMLQLGAGFKPEYTGVENIYLYGDILGIDKTEIDKKIKNIIEFADIGKHINLPVKTYSSGMYMRLAFAVSTQVDPDILIIDEALAVGDARFQLKCFKRIEQLKQNGTTIILVSHVAEHAIHHCDQALLLHEGELIKLGEPKTLAADYLKLLLAGREQSFDYDYDATNLNKSDLCKTHTSYNKNEHRIGNQKAKIVDYELLCDGVITEGVLIHGKVVHVKLNIAVDSCIETPFLNIKIRNSKGYTISGINSELYFNKKTITSFELGSVKQVCFEFTNSLANNEDYFISVGVFDIVQTNKEPIDVRFDLIAISSFSEDSTLGDVFLDWNISID